MFFGSTQLHVLVLQKMLNPGEANADHDVYEMMGNTGERTKEAANGTVCLVFFLFLSPPA